MNEKIRQRNKAKLLKPTVWIGKKGVTEAQVAELKKQLKIRKLIKVKLLNNILGRQEKDALIREVVEKSGADLIDVVGSMFVLREKRDK